MKKRNFFLFALTSAVSYSMAFAGNMGSTLQNIERKWVGTISAGPIWLNPGKTQTFYLTPGIEKTYAANKTNHAIFDGEVFVGTQKKLSSIIDGQFGIAVAATTHDNLSGQIWDDAAPVFNNYTYAYKIQHTHIAFKSKFLADPGYFLMPWVSASIGVGFNHTYSFSNTPTIFQAQINPNFPAYTRNTFTYTVGAGVQKTLMDHLQVGIGYEFSDLGQSNLGRAPGQTLGTGVSLPYTYTNGFLVNLTYLA